MSETRHNFHELMTDALDGRLGHADKERFERLLRESDERAREWEAFREMRERLVGIGTSSAPPEMFDRIAAAIRSEESGAAGPEATASSSTSTPRVTPGTWSHFTRMGVGRAAAVLLAFAVVATILLNEASQLREAASSQPAETADVEEPEAGAPDGKLKDAEREGWGTAHGDAEHPKNRGGRSGKRPAGGLLKPSLAENSRAPQERARTEQGLHEQLQRRGELARFKKLKSTLDDYEDVVAGRQKNLEADADPKGNTGVAAGRAIPASPTVGPDVMDEVMILIGKNLERFSPDELRSRGFDRFARDADDRVMRRLGGATDGSFAGGKAAPSFGSGIGGGGRQAPSGGAVGRGSRGRGSSRGRAASPRSDVAPPEAKPGRAPAPPKSKEATVTAAPGGISAPPVVLGTQHESKGEGRVREPVGQPGVGEGRVFFALLGEGAGVRARALLKEVSGVRGAVVGRAFGSSRGTAPARKEREKESSGAAQERDRSTDRPIEERAGASTSDKAAPPVYSIFEVTLPVEAANALVGRLESEKGLALRSLGKSLLPSLASGPGGGAGGARPEGANPKAAARDPGPRRTLVLVVFER